MDASSAIWLQLTTEKCEKDTFSIKYYKERRVYIGIQSNAYHSCIPFVSQMDSVCFTIEFLLYHGCDTNREFHIFVCWFLFQYLSGLNVLVSLLVLKGLTVNSPRWSRGIQYLPDGTSPKGANNMLWLNPFGAHRLGPIIFPRLHRGLFTIEPFGSTMSLNDSNLSTYDSNNLFLQLD